MWIFLNKGFFSIVEDPRPKSKGRLLAVRARIEGDLQRVFGVSDARVIELAHRDYRFRTYLSREVVSRVIADEITNMTYTNFKDSIPDHDYSRRSAYTRVWTVMFNHQEDMNPHSRKWWEDYYKYYDDDNEEEDESPEEVMAYDVYTGRHVPVLDKEEDDHQRLYPY